ncbi:MAG TPA: hypothetical protein ENK05_05145 [Gammaproteobacteria bacterium]|nr:hypothetical protein [Gammaproteobacteria bacterium]
MANDRQHWQKALHTLKQYASPRASELERELSSVRSDYTRLGLRASALASERDTLSRKLADADRHIESLHEELEAGARQRAEFDRRLDALGSELDQLRQHNQTLESRLAERDGLVDRLEAGRDRDQARIASLNRELEQTREREQRLQGRLEAQQAEHGREMRRLRDLLDRVQEQQQELLQRHVREVEGLRPGEASQGSAVAGGRTRPALLFGVPLLLGALASAATIDFSDADPASTASADVAEVSPLPEDFSTTAAMPLVGLKPRPLAVQLASLQAGTQPAPPAAPAAVRQTTAPVSKAEEPAPAWGPGGPSLLMDKAVRALRVAKPGFDPAVQQLQRDLLVLGFDIGEADGLKGRRTVQALEEFRRLYLPRETADSTQGGDEDSLVAVIGQFAEQARRDGDRYHVKPAVAAAVRLASERTGVEFGFLMELAAAESNFNPLSRSSESSAAGLFQYTRETWLKDVKSFGEQVGLDFYASKVEYYVDRKGRRRPMIKERDVYRHVLDLRFNPRVSALVAAASIKRNRERLAFSLDRQPGRTDIYLTHFLGPQGAISFLKTLDRNPQRIAGELFPRAAASNQDIFGSGSDKPRTLSEVYQIFDRKFNTDRFKDLNPG